MSKKGRLVCLLVSLCLIVVAVAGCAKEVAPTPVTPTPVTPTPAPVEVKPIKLIFSSALSPLHITTTHIMEPLVQRLELESGGRITADIFLGGELVPMGEEVSALESGIIDFSAYFLTNYKADLFPLAPVKSLPLVGTRALHVNEAYKKLLYDDAPIKDGKSWHDIMFADRAVPLKAWISMSYDGYLISTTGKRIEKPEDLVGLTLRGSGLTWLIFLDKIGATPVHLAASDMYDAMQRGTIEGSLYSIGDWHGYGFGELFRYVITGMNSGHWADSCGMTSKL